MHTSLGATNEYAVDFLTTSGSVFFGTLQIRHDWNLSLNCSQRRWETANEAGFGTFLMLCKYPSETVLYGKTVNMSFIFAFLFCSVPGMSLIEMLPPVQINAVWCFDYD